MSLSVEESILATLAYFDIFSYPLTAPEMHRSLWGNPSLLSYFQFLHALPHPTEAGKIESQHGYYFLPGRGANIAVRARAIKRTETKLQIARRGARIVRALPFVRALLVCNTVALGTAAPESDIDVVIIAENNRLWITRLLTTLALQLFRLRRHGGKITDRICLSFYLTPAAFDLSPIRISEPDIYLAYWLEHLLPLYDPDGLHSSLLNANSWTRQYLVKKNGASILLKRYQVTDTGWPRVIKKFFAIAWRGRYGDAIERQAKQIQETRMARTKPLGKRSVNSVIISDTMLKFHETDKREYYQALWRERYCLAEEAV